MKRTIIKTSIVALVFVLFGVLGSMDKKDAASTELRYCKNVSLKTWPDFNENYATQCTEKKIKEYIKIIN